MQLDDRKWTILKAIVKTYLETGEPVGSRTISKYADLNLSSATIRNEMSDLEEMGYILQPHTSAGRIPSDAGYRLYVDRMMEEKDREVTEMKELVIQRQDKMELLLKQMVKVLAANTNYAAMISGPQYHRTKLKFIQLSIVSDTQILATVVAEGNVVKNKLLEIQHGLDQKTVLEMNILLNSALNGLTIEEINLATIAKLKEQAGIHSELVDVYKRQPLSRVLRIWKNIIREKAENMRRRSVTTRLLFIKNVRNMHLDAALSLRTQNLNSDWMKMATSCLVTRCSHRTALVSGRQRAMNRDMDSRPLTSSSHVTG